ncbi:hypothetical protein [Paenibacillus monticola]|uniref:Uncharacterized protein n=1 Tax=Paenibacillus monticola TaxID=2666075 RepID=A0A7X2H2V6_9BACL|nr:hypothetical protein [Paenibacillus monticola]MRN52557.1 hypothetical protein [Paenibacillus monticola]
MINDILKYFGSCVIALGLIFCIPIGMDGGTIFSVLSLAIGALSIGLFFIGFGALLQSTHRIEMKIAGSKPHVPSKYFIPPSEKPSNVKD